MCLLDIQGIENPHNIGGHVIQRIRRRFFTDRHFADIRQTLELLAEANITVIKNHDPETSGKQPINKGSRPVNQLCAEPAHKHNRRVGAVTVNLDFQLNAVHGNSHAG